MRLADAVRVSRAVAATSGRLEKIALLAEALRALAPEERAVGVSWLAGDLPQGRIGVGWAALRSALAASPPARDASLSLGEVDAALSAVAAARGGGSAAEQARILGALLARAAEEELEGAPALPLPARTSAHADRAHGDREAEYGTRSQPEG